MKTGSNWTKLKANGQKKTNSINKAKSIFQTAQIPSTFYKKKATKKWEEAQKWP